MMDNAATVHINASPLVAHVICAPDANVGRVLAVQDEVREALEPLCTMVLLRDDQ